MQVCRLDDGEDCRQQRQSQHEGDFQLLLQLQLQLPERMDWNNGEGQVGEGCESADNVGRVVEDIRAPASSLDRLIPQVFRRLALDKNDNY